MVVAACHKVTGFLERISGGQLRSSDFWLMGINSLGFPSLFVKAECFALFQPSPLHHLSVAER